MELSTYVQSVRNGLGDAVALADDNTKRVAEQLGTAVDSSTRLALLQALTDAASEITTDLAPGSVQVRMAGNEPAFVVTLPHADDAEPTILMPEEIDEAEATAEPLRIDEDEAQARVSLRLPQSVKEKVDEYADADGVSTNTWLLHRILEALAYRGQNTNRDFGRAISDYTQQVVRSALTFPGPPTPPGPPASPFEPGWDPAGRKREDKKNRGSVKG